MIIKKNSGVTIVELLVVMGILAVIFGTSSILLLGSQKKASLNSSINRLVVDLKEQQLKAMVGDTGGSGVASPSGVYFNKTNYVLFRGQTFNSADPSNYVTNLDYGFQFSPINLVNSQIQFTPVTGTVSGYLVNSDNFSLTDPNTNEQKTIKINKLGAVISIN